MLAILLSVYQGSQYLCEQIESVKAQSVNNWVLFVRDDGSVDGSRELIKSEAARDARIVDLTDLIAGRLGAAHSFFSLMDYALGKGAQYFAFCDQDDVWSRDHLRVLVDRISVEEATYGSDLPVLAFGDMEVVDRERQVIEPSFMRYQGLRNEARYPWRVLVCQNYVTGCATMINRALAKLASPAPVHAVMHDWWLSLMASCVGRIVFIDTPILQYRQHGSNVVGAKARARFSFDLLRPSSFLRLRLGDRHFRAAMTQAHEVLERAKGHANLYPDAEMVLDRFGRLHTLRAHSRVWMLVSGAVRRQTLLGNALLAMRLLFRADPV